jgi:hypothetical protein
MADLNHVPRGEMPIIARGIEARLNARKAKGPPEPGLDLFIIEIGEVAGYLETHVSGKATADAARTALLDTVDLADANVDRWLRHLVSYTDVEARDRRSPHASGAHALNTAAFPDGLGPIDDHIIDQNIYCRAALNVLRAPEHQDTIVAIGLPAAWIDGFEADLKASEGAMDQLMMARGDKSAHIGLGRDGEAAWVDLMVRLRRHVGGRAKRGDTAKQIENKQLLEPLLVALKKLDAEAAARATRKKNSAPTAKTAEKPADAATAPAHETSEVAPPASKRETSEAAPPA